MNLWNGSDAAIATIIVATCYFSHTVILGYVPAVPPKNIDHLRQGHYGNTDENTILKLKGITASKLVKISFAGCDISRYAPKLMKISFRLDHT